MFANGTVVIIVKGRVLFYEGWNSKASRQWGTISGHAGRACLLEEGMKYSLIVVYSAVQDNVGESVEF